MCSVLDAKSMHIPIPSTAQNNYVGMFRLPVYILPVAAVLEKRPPPSDGTVAAAAVVVEPPSPRVKPAAAGCCGAVEVRTEPNVKPAPAGAAEVVEVVVRENGVADAVGLLKAKLKPVEAPVDAGAPRIKYIKHSKI